MQAENIQISFCFCKNCICLKILENVHISVNMIDRLLITDNYSVKCVFILNAVIFIDALWNIALIFFFKCNVLRFYLFGQGVPNETKGTINLNLLRALQMVFRYTKNWRGLIEIKQRIAGEMSLYSAIKS